MKRFLVLAAIVCASVSSAVSYDIRDSFSLSSAANPPWSLGFRTGFGGTAFSPMTTLSDWPFSNGMAQRWATVPSANSGFGFYRNFNAFSLLAGDVASSIIPADDWVIHPDLGDQDPVCRFTFPSAGLYEIDVSIGRMSQFSGSTRVGIFKNGVQLDDFVTASDGYTYHARPILLVTALAGDFVDFDVSSDGGTGGDSTGIRGTITAVPEPGCVTGLTACFVWMLRRRRLGIRG